MDFRVPELGEGLYEAELVAWLGTWKIDSTMAAIMMRPIQSSQWRFQVSQPN